MLFELTKVSETAAWDSKLMQELRKTCVPLKRGVLPAGGHLGYPMASLVVCGTLIYLPQIIQIGIYCLRGILQ